MTQCNMYQCTNKATETIDIWSFCDQHAKEYKEKFAGAIKAQAIKRASKANKEG